MALRRMRASSRATVRRKAGKTTNADGFRVDAWVVVHADVPFRLGGSTTGAAGSRTVTIGDTQVSTAVRVGHFPHDLTDLRDNDLVELTAGENTGAVLRIVEAGWQDQATARRVPVVEEQRPEEWSA